uniref:Ig-like domain-containing protein n=1 Tax=Poecilia mexicana TaxID=48701 RepID=A0A3B3X0I9_9TELE
SSSCLSNLCLLFWVSFPGCYPESVSEIEMNLSVRSGGSVTLSCTAADLTDPKAVIWSRTDLDSDVLSVRPGQKNSLIRHQSYQNRANLLDWQVKNGEASLVLDNVTTDDSGTYECRVQIKEKEMKRISTVSLQVSAAPPPGECYTGSEPAPFWFWFSDQVVVIFSRIRLIPGSVLRSTFKVDHFGIYSSGHPADEAFQQSNGSDV